MDKREDVVRRVLLEVDYGPKQHTFDLSVGKILYGFCTTALLLKLLATCVTL